MVQEIQEMILLSLDAGKDLKSLHTDHMNKNKTLKRFCSNLLKISTDVSGRVLRARGADPISPLL